MMKINLQTAHKLVIVGGGEAGLEVATAMARHQRKQPKAVSITLVDRDSAHVWKPILHNLAAGTSYISQQQTSFVAQAHDAGFTYQLGELQDLDRTNHQLLVGAVFAADHRLLVPPRQLNYDTLIIAIGSQANDFGTPGVAEHCFKIDSREQAEIFNQEVRLRLLECATQGKPLSIGIVGGGATGVELATELVQLAETATAYGASSLNQRISVHLIEAGSRLLAAFPVDISVATRERLESLGIQLHFDTRVKAVNADGFVLGNGSLVAASLKIWAAGVKASEILNHLDGLEANRANQLLIRPTLQTTLDSKICAIGDCSSLILPDSQSPLLPTAQVAHQQAQYLIRHLPDVRSGEDFPPDFAYRNFGSLVSLGEFDAYGSLGKFGPFRGAAMRGRLAQLCHVMLYRIHQSRVHGFWRGSLLWLVDRINVRVRSSIRLN